DPLPPPDRLRRLGGTFHSPVPTQVVVGAVAIPLAVGFVVLGLVADQIVQGESVVAGDEVHAGQRSASPCLVQIAAPREPGRQLACDSRVASPEPADTIAILSVPLRPACREAADPVTVGTVAPRHR